MADDASYTSFLNRANEPLSASKSTTTTSESKSQFDPTSQPNSSTPAPIKDLLCSKQPPHYTSDTDSPFEPFFASYSGSKLPDKKHFAKLLKGVKEGDVEVLEEKEWDPRGQYGEVVDAVRRAGGGEVKIFAVQGKGARVQYYVVTVVEGGDKVVGVMVESVES